MKIVHVVEGFGGGVYSFLVDLCNSLAEENEVVLIYAIREQTPKNFKKDFSNKIKLVNLSMSRNINPINDLKSIFRLIKILNCEKADIVHLHSSKAGVLGRVASKLLKYKKEKVFYNPHGYAFLQENVSLHKRKFYFFVEKFMSKVNGINVAVSKGEYEETKKFTNNVVRIDNAINNIELEKVILNNKKRDNNELVVGTIGRIMYQKNPKMFNSIAKEFPNLKFIWIGDGDLRNQLSEKNIEITGWKDRYEAINLMNNIDIYLQTSLWEGLPIALLEAMYMGKPVIVNNVIGNRDVINNGKNGFIANDLGEFKRYIQELINDKNLYYKVSKESREYIINNHLVCDMLEKYKNLYKQV
ncbi:glycosyltransferase [Clostridium perfringens]|uniref:glycosyltransferase n=1 Tax=Clostridium perfringens TaxID=1502 RepID=UPI0039E9B9D4